VRSEKKYKAKEPMPSKNVIAYMSSPHPSSSLQSSMTYLKECMCVRKGNAYVKASQRMSIEW